MSAIPVGMPRYAPDAGAAHNYRAEPTRTNFSQPHDKAPPELVARTWDAQGLRLLLSDTLRGDQVIVVSNRAPCTHERVNGVIQLTQPASGLVTAIEPVVRACAGTWIAHGSGSADAAFVNENSIFQVPPTGGEESATSGYSLRRLWLSAAEQSGYCDGFSNAGLWPLCHLAHVRPSFVEADWTHYRRVNQRFADAVAKEARSADPIVLVQDYHLALVPAMVRQLLPRATIVSFWHIPWGHAEQMGICPWLPELVNGLLGSDIVGFQTPAHWRNFVDSAQRCGTPLTTAERRANTTPGYPRSQGNGSSRITQQQTGAHTAQVRDYPISIAWPTPPEQTGLPSIAHCRSLAEARWALPKDAKLIVGIDRFDYTKGLLERLHAIEHLLLTRPQWQGKLRLIQVAAPSRTALQDYANFRTEVFAQVQRINARFAAHGPAPIVLLDAHHDRAAVTALYRAADLCLVTSLHDGMNLVCKEFVAARDDEQGVLVLSQFAGAADELSEALIVNPYHTAQVADALHLGLVMPAHEQRQRMRALRSTVQSRNVYRWAAHMLLDAATLRRTRHARQTAHPALSQVVGAVDPA
ncbi:MAG: alpha,alpha-trehalose-phosphate synthase (UDP-forming) [Burkholderiales bacterium]